MTFYVFFEWLTTFSRTLVAAVCSFRRSSQLVCYKQRGVVRNAVLLDSCSSWK